MLIPLYSTVTYTQERHKTNKNKLELVNLILLFVTLSSLSKLEGLHMILTWATLPWTSDNGFLWHIQSRLLLLSMSPWFLDLININTYSYVTLHSMIDTSDSNIHLSFSITYTLYAFDKLMLIILCNVDVDGYVFMSWIYFMTTIDMRHTWSTHSLLSHLIKFFLSIWHLRCAIKLVITYVLINE
jgi:hypothetical protein